MLRGNRLHIWPSRAYRGLSDADRDYIKSHRDELRALVRAGLPETTVVWQPPDPARDARLALEIEHAHRDATLKDQNPDVWLVLHGNEPDSVALRTQRATNQAEQDLRARELRRRIVFTP